MPTVSAPVTETKSTPVKQTPPPAPPQTMTTKQSTTANTVNIAPIIFILILLALCGLFTYFVARILRNSPAFSVDAPVLQQLPESTNKSSLSVEGTAPKGSTVEVTYDNGKATATVDRDGKFKAVVQLTDEKMYSFKATATKTVFFRKATSPESNTVSITFDKTAPNLKLVTPPKVVSNKDYTLEGSTSEPTTISIKVNGVESKVDTDKDNKFSVKLSFNKGDNNITVTATDKAGNETVSAPFVTTYTQGAISSGTSSTRRNGTLPNSSGELAAALNTVYARYLGIAGLVLALLGFGASSSVIYLVKNRE